MEQRLVGLEASARPMRASAVAFTIKFEMILVAFTDAFDKLPQTVLIPASVEFLRLYLRRGNGAGIIFFKDMH